MQRCEQHNIKLDSEFGKFVDDYCFKSKNLYNYANYIIRQEFINNDRWIKYNDEDRMLFYNYSNLNSYENLEFYSKHNLREMVETETTYLSLGYWGSSVEIIKEIVAHFGGGWIDENDCDDKEYYPIELNPDGNIKPVQYVTMNDIYEKFGNVVVITG